MKSHIAEQLNSGKTFNEIIVEVKREMVSQMLVRTYGNQTDAARRFGAGRSTIQKWAK